MSELISPPSRPLRGAHYVGAGDVLRYAGYFNPVAGGRGWSQVVMEENLPGWTLQGLIELCSRHRLIGRREPGGWYWRSPEVVGVVIDGETVVRDRGDLQHPAKVAARRRIDVGHTSPHMRHLRGDLSPIVVHVRASAATPSERMLHEVARAAYLASPVRPSLVLNVGHLLVDPFDPPYAGFAVAGVPLDERMATFIRSYNADMVSLLRHEIARLGRILLVTLAVHEGGEPIEIARADQVDLPPQMRSAASAIVARVLSLRSDTLLEPHRADAVAALSAHLGGDRSVDEWARAT